jgi:hypothetical protein
MNLAELQRAFQARVLHGVGEIEPLILNTPDLDARSRLAIYESAFPARLCEALAVTYPALRCMLGEHDFSALTRAFAAAYPPAHFSIRYYGFNLASFISSTQAGVRANVLSDVARWEWTLCEAFDAADAASVTQADLARVEPAQWGELRFCLSPSLRNVIVRSNAVPWWRAASEGARSPARWRSAKPIEWAIWRSQLRVQFRSLRQDEASALGRISQGQSFASMCEGLVPFAGELQAPARAAALLQAWVSSGWIVAIQT